MLQKFILGLFTIGVVCLSQTVLVDAQTADTVQLSKPAEGDSISNTYSIVWKITDDEIDDPAYFIDVFNLACSQAGGNLGRITNSGAVKDGDNYTYSWDTKAGDLANSLQNGGNYCMRICGILADGGSVYSLCDKKSFIYTSQSSDTNKPPTITAVKEGFKITINEIFSHKVEASDPDGDVVKYSFLSAPDFLTIDQSTGQISGKPTEVGDIRFIVKVDDSKGGIATEEFILNIQLTNTAKELDITFPSSGSTLSPKNNLIKWKVQSTIQVKSITISYSSDKAKWTEVTKQDRNLSEFSWNISGIEEGDYYLKFILQDTNNRTYEVISDKFKVIKDEIVTESAIAELSPTEGSTIDDSRPLISASFRTPEGVSIVKDSVKFTLNGRIDLTLCEIQETNIVCEVLSELQNGEYTTYIEIKDSAGSTIVKEWKFKIDLSDESNNNPEEENQSEGSTFQLIIIIFAIGFLLIALPWSIYLIIRKKRSSKKSEPIKPTTDSIIHPITPVVNQVNQPNRTNPNVPVVGQQGIEFDSNPIPTSPFVQSINPQVQNTNPINPLPVEPIQEMPNYFTSDLSKIPSDSMSPTNPVASIDNNLSSNSAITPELFNASTPIVDVPQSNSNDTYTSGNIAEVEQPSMYQQDEIPEWLKKDIPVATEESTDTQSTMDRVITKTEIQQGAKVYDPYGLALKPDETENTNVN
jgi:hypothetical protein